MADQWREIKQDPSHTMHDLCADIAPVLTVNLEGVSRDMLSVALLREHEPDDGYWFADSFGKDSGVCLDLLQRSGVRYEAHHALTTIDPPELVQFGKRHHPETIIDKPAKSFYQHVRDGMGLPLRQARWCCRELKEWSGEGRVVVTGVRAAESSKRASRGQVEFCDKGLGKFYVKPIFHWSTGDVWEYTRLRVLPYCGIYDQGWKRLGCVICPNERNVERAMQRWPRIFAGVSRAVEVAYTKQKGFHKFGSPQGVMRWWIDRDAPYTADDGNECFAFDQFEED